jgi:hypothetical protein
VFSTSPESEDHWEVKKEEIYESEFDETRRCLLNSYNSYIQTHAGYMIALIIGLLTLISAFGAFFKSLELTTVFILLIIAILLVSFYVVVRIYYWTYFANTAISVTIDDVILLFNKNNTEFKSFTKKPPCLAILQIAISQKLLDEKDAGTVSWVLEIAVKAKVLLFFVAGRKIPVRQKEID